jgi:hypothetical protein
MAMDLSVIHIPAFLPKLAKEARLFPPNEIHRTPMKIIKKVR